MNHKEVGNIQLMDAFSEMKKTDSYSLFSR